MLADFSKPQRQSPIGVLVMFFDTVRQFARAFWPVLLLYIFRVDTVDKLMLFLGIALFIIVAGVAAYLKYLNFTFHIDTENDEFVVQEGIFNKSKTAIQLEKIQQVNINQSLIQRIISVYELDVDTAGSTNKEGKIKAVSHDLALALKARLLDNDKRIVRSNELEVDKIDHPTDARPIINISLLSLLKVGITSNYIRSFGLILAFFITIYENVQQLANNDAIDGEQIDAYFAEGFVARSIMVFIAMMIVLILVINVVRTVVKYYNFQMTRQSGSILLSFGLISTKSTILRPQRVQIATITRNFFQKKLDVAEIKIRQAGGGEGKQKDSIVEIPGCSEAERSAIMNLLYDTIPEKGVALMPNIRKLLFSVFLTIVLPLGIFGFVGYIENEVLQYSWIAPVYVVFAGLILFFSFRNYRLFVGDRFVIKQSGAWDISNDIIEPTKIQAISTSQLFWHKRLNIGSITIHTAGGNVDFQLGDFDRIKEHVNRWLYEMETSDSNWM